MTRSVAMFSATLSVFEHDPCMLDVAGCHYPYSHRCFLLSMIWEREMDSESRDTTANVYQLRAMRGGRSSWRWFGGRAWRVRWEVAELKRGHAKRGESSPRRP